MLLSGHKVYVKQDKHKDWIRVGSTDKAKRRFEKHAWTHLRIEGDRRLKRFELSQDFLAL